MNLNGKSIPGKGNKMHFIGHMWKTIPCSPDEQQACSGIGFVDLPPSREDANRGGVAVELGGPYGLNDGILGDRGGAEAGEAGGVPAAERDDRPRVVGVQAVHQQPDDSPDRGSRGEGKALVCLEPPSLLPHSVLRCLPRFWWLTTALFEGWRHGGGGWWLGAMGAIF